MRNPLNKRLFRDIKNHKGRYLAISIMLIVTISLLSGFLSVAESINKGVSYNKVECKVEDGNLESFFELNKDVLKQIEDLEVQIYENFYKDKEILENKKLRIYKNREHIDKAIVTEGELPLEDNEIAIDRLFAKQNSLKVGSFINIEDKDYKITGTLALPDYTSLFENNSDIMMNSIYFGVAIVSDDALEKNLSGEVNYKYSYYYNNRDLNKKQKNDLDLDIEKVLVNNNISIKDFCIQENNQSISFIEDDMGSDEPMMKVFCYILIVILAFVFTVTISSTIEEDAAIIGTLLANGYKKIEILLYYIKVSMLVIIMSALIGNILGYTLMPDIFKIAYYTSYSLPDFNISINNDAIIITTIIPICIMLIINVVFIAKKLSISPLKFIRKELRKNDKGKSIKLPNISFLKRFRLRVIIQNRTNFLILFLGILFGSVILIFGMCMKPAIEKYIDNIKETNIADYQYVLKAPYKVNEDDTEKFTLSSFNYSYNKIEKDFSISFYGIEENSEFLQGLSFDENCGEIYLNDSFMKKIKAKEGDIITFNNPYTDEEYELKVAGSYNYSAGLAVFMNRKKLNELLGYDKDYFNGYFSNKKLNIDDKYLASIIIVDDIIKLGEQMTSSLGGTAYVCVVAAVLIYMALMYVLTKIVIDKNSLYISYMKVFGYNNSEIKKLYLNAVTIFVVVSLIIQIPLVDFILKKSFDIALLKVNGYMEVSVPWYLYIALIIIGVMSYIIINHFHMRDVNNIKMSEALKNRE